MKLETLTTVMNNYRKGTFTHIGWKSEVSNASAKKQNLKIDKVSECIVRLKINYSNIVYVRKVRDCKTSLEARPIWYKHSIIEGIVEHKDDSNKKYLQVFAAKHNYPKTKWFINGKETTKEYLLSQGLINQSAVQSNGELIMFTVPIENIKFIGKFI